MFTARKEKEGKTKFRYLCLIRLCLSSTFLKPAHMVNCLSEDALKNCLKHRKCSGKCLENVRDMSRNARKMYGKIKRMKKDEKKISMSKQKSKIREKCKSKAKSTQD